MKNNHLVCFLITLLKDLKTSKEDFKKVREELKKVYEKDEDKAWTLRHALEECDIPNVEMLNTINKLYEQSKHAGMTNDAISSKLSAILNFNAKRCKELGITLDELSQAYDKVGQQGFFHLTYFDAENCYKNGIKITDLAEIYRNKGREAFDDLTSLDAQNCYEQGVTLQDLVKIYDHDKVKFKALTSYSFETIVI